MEPKGLYVALQEAQSIHDYMNIPKIEFIAYIYISELSLTADLQFWTPFLVLGLLFF